jgi:peptidyl-prolyl cis-trans isomerase A (cyclophilin A)
MFRSILLVLAFALVPQLGAQDTKPAEKKTPDARHPRVKMETSLGDIVLELNAEKAPITVDNFLRYAEDGFYDDTIFHRVISTFMIQGGGFTAEMEEKKEGLREPIKNEWQNGLKNARGTISMARKGGDPDSASSQFFINVVDNKRLDMPQRDKAAYAVFGHVVDGMDVVDKIKDTEVTEHAKLPMGKVVPVEPIVIKSVTLLDGLKFADVAAVTKPAVEAAAKAKAAVQAEVDAQAAAFKELLTKGADENGNKIERTASGLMYIALKEGDGPTPELTDMVSVHYTGWLMNGTKFDSSADRGQPARFKRSGVIKGWTEALGLMKVGAKYRLIIPPDLAYGKRGRSPTIPPQSTLVFDVELLAVE